MKLDAQISISNEDRYARYLIECIIFCIAIDMEYCCKCANESCMSGYLSAYRTVIFDVSHV